MFANFIMTCRTEHTSNSHKNSESCWFINQNQNFKDREQTIVIDNILQVRQERYKNYQLSNIKLVKGFSWKDIL